MVRLGSVLTAAEVVVGASHLARDCALIDYLVTDVTNPTATLHAPDGRAIRPVRNSLSIEDITPGSFISGNHTRLHSNFHLEHAGVE